MTTTEQDREQMEAERSQAIAYFKSYDDWQYATLETVARWMFERGWNERNKKVMELQARIDKLISIKEPGDREPLIQIMD